MLFPDLFLCNTNYADLLHNHYIMTQLLTIGSDQTLSSPTVFKIGKGSVRARLVFQKNKLDVAIDHILPSGTVQ